MNAPGVFQPAEQESVVWHVCAAGGFYLPSGPGRRGWSGEEVRGGGLLVAPVYGSITNLINHAFQRLAFRTHPDTRTAAHAGGKGVGVGGFAPFSKFSV